MKPNQILLCCAYIWIFVGHAEAAERRNVLFIAVDDLRPALGCYGDERAVTPRIDALARRGFVFERAYCQQAVCNPSRASVMTGRRPDTTRVYDLKAHFREALPDVVTLPQWFKRQGYQTRAVGKLYHGVQGSTVGDGLDDPPSWSLRGELPQLHFYHSPEGMRIAETWFAGHRAALIRRYPQLQEGTWKDAVIRGLPWEAPEVADEEVIDGRIATRALEMMGALRGQPFFLAVGFLKPHVPFVAPKQYFDLYPEGAVEPVADPEFPVGAPKFAGLDSREMRVYHGIPNRGPVADAEGSLDLVRAYYACVSYIDAQVGRLLDGLDALGLRENTVVVLWGDHGYHLGENGFWCKQTNFERSTRSPLILSVPGQANAGGRTRALVELVDLYPTVTEAAGLPVPGELEGISLLPLLEQPDRPWKGAAFSQYPRQLAGPGRVMGRSLRTDRYRFTEWKNGKGDFRVVELYDHDEDPGETRNVAGEPGHAELLRELTRQLNAGWRAALPPDSRP